jgi:hypothetical protein
MTLEHQILINRGIKTCFPPSRLSLNRSQKTPSQGVWPAFYTPLVMLWQIDASRKHMPSGGPFLPGYWQNDVKDLLQPMAGVYLLAFHTFKAGGPQSRLPSEYPE